MNDLHTHIKIDDELGRAITMLCASVGEWAHLTGRTPQAPPNAMSQAAETARERMRQACVSIHVSVGKQLEAADIHHANWTLYWFSDDNDRTVELHADGNGGADLWLQDVDNVEAHFDSEQEGLDFIWKLERFCNSYDTDLFPNCDGVLDVLEQFGMLTPPTTITTKE